MLGTAAALALAAGARAQTGTVAPTIEGTGTVPGDLAGRPVYAVEGDAGDTALLTDVPPGWIEVGVIEELAAAGGGVEVAFAPGLMAEDEATSAEVPAERLRLIPDRDDPGNYFVLLDVAGTPLASVIEGAGRDRPAVAADEPPEGAAVMADEAELAPEPEPEPEPGAEVVVISPEAEAEPLREVDIADPDAPPIEDATEVVPESDPGDGARVPEIAAETGLTSPTGTAAMPAEGVVAPPGVAPEGFAVADMSTMDPTQLLGVRVYSGDDERIGEIGRWIGEATGRFPEAAVVNVGGLLGLGEREVAIPSDRLTLMADADGNDLRVYVEMTGAEIEGLPEIAD